MDRVRAISALSGKIPIASAILVGLTGILAIASWAFGLAWPAGGGADGFPILPMAAICLILGALALGLADSTERNDLVRILHQTFAVVLALIALFAFAEYALDRNLGLDLLLFPRAVLAAPWRPAGRIPVNGVGVFLLYALALQSVHHDRKARDLRAQMFASAGLLITLVALLGYVFTVPGLYAVSESPPMTLPAVFVHLVLGIGILFAHRERGVSALLTDVGPAGVMMRRLLPAAVVVPILMGLARLAGEHAGLYQTDFGVSIFATASILTFAVVVVWAARVVREMDHNRSELILREQQSRAAAERARLEAEAARTEAETASTIKTDFLAVMSHELRTPLTAIMGYEELLSDGITGPVTDLQRQQLGRINASAHHLLGLIDEILTFARVDIGREKVHMEPISLNSAIHEAADLVQPMAASKAIRFVVVDLFEDHTVETDRTKLKQMLVNLLSNAIKFTDEGEVRLTSAIRGKLVEICVSDTGIGIEPGNVDVIFEPFWQVEQGATRKSGGTGLGLSVTRKLARLLGGDVSVKTGVGRGSTFTLSLPLEPARAIRPLGRPSQRQTAQP